MRRHLIIVFVVTLVTTGTLGAQSAAMMDSILAEERLSYGSAAYLILGALDQLPESSAPADILARLHEMGLGFPRVAHNDEITLGRYALLIMLSLEIDGGYVYSLTRSARYAARELEFLDAIQGRAFPGMSLSGEQGIRILNRTLALREEGQL